MTLNHFFFAAGYILWFYIIVYITVRMFAKFWRDWRKPSYYKIIEKFFESDSRKRTVSEIYRICRINDDNEFFKYTCDCYLKGIENCSEEQKIKLKKYITDIVDYKIYKTAKHNRLTRCLVIGSIDRCSLESKRIKKFIKKSRKAGNAQKQWLLYTKEFNESLQEGENKWKS